ncbi:hypothetical protein DSECCO2_453460 [anaerobic digester metagenome]
MGTLCSGVAAFIILQVKTKPGSDGVVCTIKDFRITVKGHQSVDHAVFVCIDAGMPYQYVPHFQRDRLFRQQPE